MTIRKATEADFPEIIRLARGLDLDYNGMETDDFFVAEQGGQVLGICGLKKHPECLELCSLGVEKDWQGRGLGRQLVRVVLGTVPGDLYLATVIPGFFARFGFGRAEAVPPSMVKKAEWCAGCRPELCTVMLKKGRE